jgi:hypothetical protein
MVICLICSKETLEADEKVVVIKAGARSMNESSKKRKQTHVTAVVRECFHK